MKSLYLALLLTMLALPCFAAATIYPPLPVDGNGNVAPVVKDEAAGVWLTDSGVRTIAGGNMTVADTPYTTTGIAYDTELTGTTFDTFALNASYDMIYVSSDTDVIISLSYAEAAANSGDVSYAGVATPFNFRTNQVWIRTKTGLAMSGGRICVRGMR